MANEDNELKIKEMQDTVIKVMAEMGYESKFDDDGYYPFSLNTDNKEYYQGFDSEEEMSYLNDVSWLSLSP